MLVDEIVRFLDKEGILPSELNIEIFDYDGRMTEDENLEYCYFDGNKNTIFIIDFSSLPVANTMSKQNEILREIINRFGFTTALLLHELGHFFFLYYNYEQLVEFNEIDVEVYDTLVKKFDIDILFECGTEAKKEIESAYSVLYTSTLNEQVANRNALLIFEYLKENFKHDE